MDNPTASEISQLCENHHRQLSLESIDDYDQLRVVVGPYTFYYATRVANTLVYIDKVAKWYLIYDCTGFQQQIVITTFLNKLDLYRIIRAVTTFE